MSIGNLIELAIRAQPNAKGNAINIMVILRPILWMRNPAGGPEINAPSCKTMKHVP